MAESKQTFEGGLSMDLSQAFNKKGTYIDALNVDIILDEINGSIALTNSKGNKLQLTIPQTGYIHNWSTKTSGHSMITLGMISYPWEPNASSTNKQLYDFIVSKLTSYISDGSVKVYYDEARVVIVENPIISNGSISLNSPGTAITTNSSLEVPRTFIHYPIGYGVIGEDIYIITTSSNSPTTGGPGFFWKFNYNKETFNGATIQLLYGAQLNMSTYYHIPPTAVVTRYETDAIKKMWFTDFYNPLRSIVLTNSMLMTEDPTTFSEVPGVTLYKPILTGVTDGGSVDLAGGIYQACYRLTKTLGTSSVYSQLSNLVPIGDTPLSSSYQDYIGGVSGTPAIITWKVSNIDTNYDYIELIVLIRKTDDYGASYDIVSVATEKIDNQTSISFSVGQSEINSGTPSTLAEIIVGGYSGFTHCKTIAEKDNLLIAANLKTTISNEGLNYDSRAYRFNSSGDLALTDKGVTTIYPHPVTNSILSLISSDSDAINPDPEIYKFKRDGYTLGGEGINISYEFTTEDFLLDQNISVSKNVYPLSTSVRQGDNVYAPFFTTIKATDTINLNVKSPVSDQLYVNDFYNGYKNPQTSGLLKGYMRNETYRFANNFYTKDNSQLFAEWIGDIKFPDYNDINSTAQGDFRTVSNYYNGILDSNKLYGHILGIKFTLNNIPTNIGGYSIVRVERTYADRSVLFQGCITGVDEGAGPEGDSSSQYFSSDFTNTSNIDKIFIRSGLVGEGDNTISSGFKVRHCYGLSITDGGQFIKRNINDNTSALSKMYSYNKSSIKQPRLDIAYSQLLTSGEVGSLNGTKVRSRSIPLDFKYSGETLAKRRFKDYGTSKCYFLHTPSVSSSDIASLMSSSNTIVSNIETVNPNQYGGKDHTSRSSNIYISCGHYRIITDNNQATSSETFKVFGGDIFLCLNDIDLKNKNWDSGTTDGERLQYNIVVPLESTENIDLAGPTRLNRSFSKSFDDSNTSWLSTRDVRYFTVYSSEDTIKQYLPKPSIFFEVNKWINRFAASNIKINGELEESWSQFPVGDVWDAEGQYGEINSILSRDSKLYFWQDRAFGIMQVNPRAYIGDLSNSTIDVQIQLGFGNKLQRHDYISTTSGSKHQGSTLNTVSGLFWFDINNKKVFKFTSTKDGISATSESDVKGLYAYLSKNIINKIVNSKTFDKPCYVGSDGKFGITSGYDVRTGKVYFTFHNGTTSITLCYNERTDAFTSFYSSTPNMYISDYNNVFTFNNQSIYVNEKGDYNNYYGVLQPSRVKFIVNDASDVTKMFSNVNISTQSIKNGINLSKNTWSKIRVTNDYQDTGSIDLIVDDNIRRIERVWKLAIPRNRMTYDVNGNPDTLSPVRLLFGDRIRDSYINIELEYNNPDNNLLKTSIITTVFNESPR